MNQGEDKAWFSAFPVRRPRVVLGVGIMAALVSLIGIFQLKPTGSLHSMFPEGNPAAQAMAHIVNRFPATDTLLLWVTSEPPDSRARLLAFAESLAEKLNRHEDTVSSVIYKPPADARALASKVIGPNLIYYVDDMGMIELRRRLTPEGMAERFAQAEAALASPGAGAALGKRLQQDPLALHELVLSRVTPSGTDWSAMATEEAHFSRSGNGLLIQIRGTGSVGDMEFVSKLMRLVRSCVSPVPTALAVEYTGAYAIAEAAQERIRVDMMGSVFGAVLLCQCLFWLTYRAWWVFPLALAPVALGIAAAFGIMGVWSPYLSPPTAVIGGILAGLGIDYSIHFLSACRNAAPQSNKVRLHHVIQHIGPAMLAAALTSVIAFGAVASSDIPALRDFATLGVLGLLFSFIAVITLLPAALSYVSTDVFGERWVRWSLVKPLAWVDTHRTLCLSLFAGLTLAALLLIGFKGGERPWLEPNLNAMHPSPNRPLEVQKQVLSEFTHSGDPLLVYLHADDEASLIQLAHEVRRRIEAPQPKKYISGSYGLAHLLPDPSDADARLAETQTIDVAKVIKDFDEAIHASAFAPGLFSEYRSYLQSLLRPGQPPSLTEIAHYPTAASFLPSDGSRLEALTYLFPARSIEDRNQRQETIHSLHQAMTGLEGAIPTGMDVIAYYSERAIQTELATLAWSSGLFVLVWLFIYFRRTRRVCLALVPVVFAGVAMAATMILLDMKLNMVNLVAIPLLIGLGIDYGIFTVSIATSTQPGTSLKDTAASSGQAMVLSSLTTIAGFGSLITTSVPAIQSLGVMMAVGSAACLVAVFFCLMPCIAYARGVRPR